MPGAVTTQLATNNAGLYFGFPAQLSDGTLVFTYEDASGVFHLGYTTDRINVTSIATDARFKDAAVAVDPSDNLYVISQYNSSGSYDATVISFVTFTKGTGYSWTITTWFQSAVSGYAGANFGGVGAAAWINCTSLSRGAVIFSLDGQSAYDQFFVTFDCAKMAAGTEPHIAAQVSRNHYNCTRIVTDGYGSTNVAAASFTNYGSSYSGALDGFVISATGTFTSHTSVASATGECCDVVPIGGGRFYGIVCGPQFTGGSNVINYYVYSATALVTYGTVTLPTGVIGTTWMGLGNYNDAATVYHAGWTSAAQLVYFTVTIDGTGIPGTPSATTNLATTVSNSGEGVGFKSAMTRGAGWIDWLFVDYNSVSPGTFYENIYALQGSTAPNAPTSVSPASGSYMDVTSGIPETYQYNSTDNGNQNAYAARIKTSGGSYNYYNAATNALQSSVVWNTVSTAPSADWSFTIPAAAVSNGNVYNFSAASQESLANQQGAFAPDATLNAQAAPNLTVTGPTGSVVNTNQPTVTWTPTPASGATQTAWQVRVFSAAQYGITGFDPATSPATWDSGVVAGNAQTAQIGTALTNGTTYRAYVQVTETGGQTSSWVYTSFTLALDPPATPTITATNGVYPGSSLPCLIYSVQGRDNWLSANQASLETGATTGWTEGANTTIGVTTANPADGSYAMTMTATAGGAVSASTPTGPGGQPVTPGQQVTALASFLAQAAGQTGQVVIYWWKSDGTASTVLPSSASPSVAAPTAAPYAQAAVTAIAPADAAYLSVSVEGAGLAASGVIQVDKISVAPGASTTWTRGGLAGSTTAAVLRSDGLYARGASTATPAALPAGTQQVTLYDPEVTPGVGYTATATVSAVLGATATITSSASGATASASVALGNGWWLFVVTAPSTSSTPDAPSVALTRNEQSATHIPVGSNTAVVITGSGVMAADGMVTFATYSAGEEAALAACLESQQVLFLSSPLGASYYGRVGPPAGMGSSSVARLKQSQIEQSTPEQPIATHAVTWIGQNRPTV